jgi:hypothetical protein
MSTRDQNNSRKRCSDVIQMVHPDASIDASGQLSNPSFLSGSLLPSLSPRINHHGIHGTRDRPQPDNLCSQPEREDQQDRYIAHPYFLFVLDRPLDLLD